MAWEQIIAKRGILDRAARYGEVWTSGPAVAVNKGGIQFNDQFINSFGVAIGQRMRVCLDEDGKRFGFKILTNGDDLSGSYTVGVDTGKKGNASKSNLKISCITFLRRIPNCCGKAFKARMNPGERIIECQY